MQSCETAHLHLLCKVMMLLLLHTLLLMFYEKLLLLIYKMLLLTLLLLFNIFRCILTVKILHIYHPIRHSDCIRNVTSATVDGPVFHLIIYHAVVFFNCNQIYVAPTFFSLVHNVFIYIEELTPIVLFRKGVTAPEMQGQPCYFWD